MKEKGKIMGLCWKGSRKKERKNIKNYRIYHATAVVTAGTKPVPTIQAPTYFTK